MAKKQISKILPDIEPCPRSDQTAEKTPARIQSRAQNIPGFHQCECIITEGRECGESPQDADDQKETNVLTDDDPFLEQRHQQSDHEAADDIHRHRPIREETLCSILDQ